MAVNFTTVFPDIMTTENGTLGNITDMYNSTAVKKNSNTVLPVVMLFLFGTVGNMLAMAVLLYTAKKHQWRTFYRLVAALAVSDFTGIAVPLIISMANYANGKKWLGGQPLCNFMSFTLIICGMASAMLACAMSMDRFLAVWYPHVYNTKLTKRKTTLMLIGLVLTALLIACLPLFGLNANVHQFPGTWCFFNMFATEPKDKLFAIFYASMGILMIVVMLICNTMVVIVLAKRCQGPSSMKRASVANSKANKSKLNDIYNLVFLAVLMTAFTICWVPLCVRILINQMSTLPPNRRADLLVMRLSLVNQILDPWIYILLRKDSIKRCIQFGKKHTKPGSFLHKIGDEADTNETTNSALNSSTDSVQMKRDHSTKNIVSSGKYSLTAYSKANGNAV